MVPGAEALASNAVWVGKAGCPRLLARNDYCLGPSLKPHSTRFSKIYLLMIRMINIANCESRWWANIPVTAHDIFEGISKMQSAKQTMEAEWVTSEMRDA